MITILKYLKLFLSFGIIFFFLRIKKKIIIIIILNKVIK